MPEMQKKPEAQKKKIAIKAFAPAAYAAYVAQIQKRGRAGSGPGSFVDGQGIYLGRYEPKDHDGKSLGKIFNVYAAPEDLPGLMTYDDAVKHLAGLENWHGHDGAGYRHAGEIYAALKGGSYDGIWVIPPRELLTGTAHDDEAGIRSGEPVQPDNLLAHRDKDAFRGTFSSAAAGGADAPSYWSSTAHWATQDAMWVARFSDGREGLQLKKLERLNCRPVRLVFVRKAIP